MKLVLFAALAVLAVTPALAASDLKSSADDGSSLTLKSGGYLPPEQAAVRLEHADLHIKVIPAGKRIEGVAAITLRAAAPVSAAVLDFDRRFAVSSVTVDGVSAPWRNDQGRMRITLPRPLATGERVTTQVAYAGAPLEAKNAPWDGGFVWSKSKAGKPWIASAVQGPGCDLFWPCVDNPLGEVEHLDLSVTVPEGLTAPGNGVLVEQTTANGWTTFHWRAREVNPYSVAINVGPYGLLQGEFASQYGNTIPMRFWYLEENGEAAKGLFAQFPQILEFMETWVGPYPWADEKMGVVETPHLGMEHQSINAYGNGYKPDQYPYDWLLQHEFSHEWFGNQLTNADWDDMWLHEGFGQYMQPLYVRQLMGDRGYFAKLQADRMRIREEHPLVSGKVLMTDEAEADGDIYFKGALVLHTLREMIGDQAFRQALRVLVYGRPDPAPGNFEPRFGRTQDFVDAVSKVTGRDMGWFFDVYLREAALPELIEEHQGEDTMLRWKAPGGKPFPMPLEVQVGETLVTLPMTGGEGRIHAPRGTVVIVDPHSKVLRHEPHVQVYQAYLKKKAEEEKAKAAAKTRR